MPSTGCSNPAVRSQVTKFLQALYNAGGGPKLKGVFYFTEKNLNPQNWEGDSDEFWNTLNETCDLVVGEHYHNYEFIFSNSLTQLENHFFALPKWLNKSGKKAQMEIATQKYAVLHSSYYGPDTKGWAGVQSEKHNITALEKYFQYLVQATRQSEFGKRLISFGPLPSKDLESRVYPVIAKVLNQDAKK